MTSCTLFIQDCHTLFSGRDCYIALTILLKGEEELQRDFGKKSKPLEDWTVTNHTRFNKSKCWILHLG